MKKRVTIYDIAEKSGFSVGTVNRALSGKSRISPETKKLILATAEKLGYKANLAAQSLRRAPITLGAVLSCPVEEYVDSIIDGINFAAADLEKYNVTIDIQKIEFTDGADCANKTYNIVNKFADKNYNGIILFMSSSDDEMKELSALIDDLAQKNIFVATVANDIPSSKRIIHVAPDAFMAGQLAAQLLEFSCAGEDVALLVSRSNVHVSTQYVNGFTEYAKDGLFSSVKIYEHYDNESKVINVTDQMLIENPDLKGVYMTTAASHIACNHIKNTKKGGLKIISTDLLSETPEFLAKKIATATIFQNPFRQGKIVTERLYQYITTRECDGVHLIAPHILLSSNVAPYLNNDIL